MKEIKQWEDRKTRAVTKGEKKFIEKQIKELKDNLKVCRSKATSFKKGDKMKTRKGTKVLGYSGTVYNKYNEDRIDVRIIGKVTQKYFIEKVAAEFFHTTKNWIRERICETGNEVEVNLANEQVGTIFILDENKQILESFSKIEELKKEGEMKKIYTSKKCAGCQNVVYDGIMVRTTYRKTKRLYFCGKSCFELEGSTLVGEFEEYFKEGLLEFVKILDKKEKAKVEKFEKDLKELNRDKVAEYEKIENEEINKVKTRKEALQDEIKIYGDMIEKLRVELEQTISTSNIERIKNTIDSHKEQIEEDYMEIAKLDKRDVYSEMTMDEKVSLDEIQNYLRDHEGLLFDDDGYTITDIEVDKYGNIVATTKHQGMVIRLDKNYLDRLHKRMRLVKFMQKEKRSVEMINWKMKEAKNWYNSDDFQYAGNGENGRSEYTKKGANEIADEKEQIVKDRLEAELFLVENEIERLKKLREILKHYDYEIGMRNFYYMTTYDDEGEEI